MINKNENNWMLQDPSFGRSSMQPPAWLSYDAPVRPPYRYPAFDRPPYDPRDRPPMSRQPYDHMRGYEPYMDRPSYGRYAERTVFDYSDHHRDGAGYSSLPPYGSASDTSSRSGFSRQVVDYNHGSLSAASADDRDAAKREQQIVALSRDVDQREIASRSESRRSPPYQLQEDRSKPTTAVRADVDIKFIQDTIVSIQI